MSTNNSVKLRPVSIVFALSAFRYPVVLLYSSYMTIVLIQWVQYQVTSKESEKFYGVDQRSIDQTVNCWYPVYLIGFPLVQLTIYNKGIRYHVILASGCNFLGTLFKLASCYTRSFSLALAGQSLVGVSLANTIFLPTKIAILWFPSEKVSTIVSIACTPAYLGPGLGYIIPTGFMSLNRPDDELITWITYSYTVISGMVFFAILLFFADKPTHPASVLSIDPTSSQETPNALLRNWINILSNRNALLVVICYTAIQTTNNVLVSLMAPIFESLMLNSATFAGQCGLLMMLVAIPSGIILGRITDRTRRYRLITWMLSLPYWPLLAGLLYLLKAQDKTGVILVMICLGAVLSGSFSIGMDFLSQITYPIPETVSSGLLYFFSVTLSWGVGEFFSFLLPSYGPVVACVPIFIIITIACFTVPFLEENLNREEATATAS